MRWFLIALLGLGIVLPTLATHSFAQNLGNSANSASGQTGQVGNQGSNGKDVGNAGGTHKAK